MVYFRRMEHMLRVVKIIEENKFYRGMDGHLGALFSTLPGAVNEIEYYLGMPQFNCYKNKCKLCISQMSIAIPSLVHVLTIGNHPAFEDAANYNLEKLKWCLMEPMRMFNGGGVAEDTETSDILFVNTIDWAICSLQAGEPVDDAYKSAIDDLLCQALTIAKLAAGQDYNEISSGCRSVLVSLNAVLDNKETEGTSKHLQRDILLCNLETLYRRVNTSVLRLFLYVMSDNFSPLKNIVIKCVQTGADDPTKKRHSNDLDQLITKLDLYFEQIHLVGNFAVACTDSSEEKLDVKCCLASLEFCETHLVPTITAFYLQQQSRKRNFLSFLTDEAQRSLKELHSCIDRIVDTASFARVVFEDLADLTCAIREKFSDGVFEKSDCELFHKRCNRLLQHLMATEKSRQDPHSQRMVKQLLTVLKNQSVHLKNFIPTSDHIVRDLDLILDQLDRLCHRLNFFSMNSSVGHLSIDRCVNSFPDSVRNLPLDTATPKFDKSNYFAKRDDRTWLESKVINRKSDKTEETNEENNVTSSALEPYLSKIGETPMIKSTFYCRTPLRTPKSTRALRNGNFTTYKFSDLLAEVSKVSDNSVIKDVTKENISGVSNANRSAQNNQPSQSFNKSSDVSKVDEEERLRDILFLEDKLSQLKTS